jgi:hypothetical protein
LRFKPDRLRRWSESRIVSRLTAGRQSRSQDAPKNCNLVFLIDSFGNRPFHHVDEIVMHHAGVLFLSCGNEGMSAI